MIMDIDETGKVLREYIFENKGINTPFGKAEYISSDNPRSLTTMPSMPSACWSYIRRTLTLRIS